MCGDLEFVLRVCYVGSWKRRVWCVGIVVGGCWVWFGVLVRSDKLEGGEEALGMAF